MPLQFFYLIAVHPGSYQANKYPNTEYYIVVCFKCIYTSILLKLKVYNFFVTQRFALTLEMMPK
jgi:hypothetical protein